MWGAVFWRCEKNRKIRMVLTTEEVNGGKVAEQKGKKVGDYSNGKKMG